MKKRDVKALIHDKGLENVIQLTSIGGVDRYIMNGVAMTFHDWDEVYDIVYNIPAKTIPKGLSDKELAAYIPEKLREHISIERR